MAKADSVIKFLKFSSDEALRSFKIHDRFQMIHLVHKIVDKDIALQKVKLNIEELQKEIKDVYSLFKPLIEKGLPHFLGWRQLPVEKGRLWQPVGSKKKGPFPVWKFGGELKRWGHGRKTWWHF